MGGGWVGWSLSGREEDPLTIPPAPADVGTEDSGGDDDERDEYVQRILDELGEG